MAVNEKTLSDKLNTFFTHLKALCLKQVIYSFRKPETTVAQFIGKSVRVLLNAQPYQIKLLGWPI